MNGDVNGYCTRDCTCGVGEGDCDYNLQCEEGLTCVANNGAMWGMPARYDVCDVPPVAIADVAAGALLITEVMQNPAAVNDSEGEWFEIVNTSADTIDLDGMVVTDLGTNSFTVTGRHLVGPGAYFVFGNNADTGANGNFDVDYEFPGAFALGNSDDEIVLTGGVEIDRVEWDGGPSWPDPTGASMNLAPGAEADNNNAANWCEATAAYGAGDLGTPGSANSGC